MIESELLGPTPRKVVVREKLPLGWKLGCGAFAFIFLAVGLFGLISAIHKTYVRSYGIVVPGRISGEAYRGEDSITSTVPVTYSLNGQDYHGKVGVDHASASRLRIGGPVELKVLPSTPTSHVMVVGNSAGDSEITFWWLWAAGWNSFVWIPIGLALWGKNRMKRVAMYGKPVVGRIVKKDIQEGESSKHHYLHYSFRPHAGSQDEVKGRESVNADQFNSVNEGDQMTVLYLENKPKISTLYQFGYFRADN